MILNSALAGSYNGKRVLVTGHSGFKGSWLSIWLKELDAEVIGYSIEPPSVPNNFEACDLESKITHLHGDIRDLEQLQTVFEKCNPEIVFHLAAQPLVRLSYADPHTTYETNVMGTLNVLEAARHTPSVRVIVVVTSDKCYENKEWVWGYRESGSPDAWIAALAQDRSATLVHKCPEFEQIENELQVFKLPYKE